MTTLTLRQKTAAFGLLAAVAIAAHAQTPVVDCVVLNTQTGMYTAYFGYTGTYSSSATIPAGTSNYVDSTAVLRGAVPTSFPPNSQHMLFSLTFTSTLTPGWHLNGATATASSAAASSCQVPVATQLANTALTRCWDRNANQTCDPWEDVDGDGFCTILDCAGPAGQTGAMGPAGPQGSVGPTGPAGTVPVFQTVTVSPALANATASCGANQFLVTGGGVCTVPNLAGAGRVATSAPSSNGWTVSCNAGQAVAVAVCAPQGGN
jgi:hypothetical protein